MKSTAHSPPLNSISGVSSAAHLLPAAPIPTSNRAKKTDRLGRKQRDKLDHNRERREAQEAEKEVRISNRQASRKRKKEKREAKLEARAAMAPHQESLTEPIELLETTEQAEGSRNEEDTSQMPETDVISTPDAASMSAGLKVDDSAGGVVTADIQHHGNRVSALDTTQAEIDRLFTSISQSTAYEKLLNVCEVSAEEEPLVCPVGEVITRLEGYLENLSTSPSVGESKSGKKKRVKKKKVKNTQSKVATGLQLFVGKSTVPLPSHDEEGPVEVSVDSSSSLISTSGEPVLGLCLTDLGGANLRLRALRTTHFNVEECGSTLEVLGTVATQVQREEKLSPTSVEQSLPLLILSDAATSDPTSILEPTASIITGPSSKTKSKKKKKKKKAKKASAAATPEETSKAGNKAPQSSGPVHALRCVTKLCNEWQRQWLFIVLCPLLNLKINDYFEHLRVQLYEQGFCDSLNTKWRFLVHAVWKFEGAFARIEGWQQSQDVPASFRLDPPNIDAPRFKDFFAIANDDDRDWMEMDEDVKRSLVVQERYISLCWEDTTVAVGRRRCLGAAS
ncbi:hypothetical protein CspeluHIS016_0113810 [Cutaneotrichosporon spelunceum]|uniref:Uncharacterized protein n=1 Tax=Cutaneotrichosporon spelunceum TaxID=1672016 RepID=A0AAD3TQ56_9TREE|nr:hypothetical protein CspeluHIS016_0113810 [Cutaneotrichosporon spelunceum]